MNVLTGSDGVIRGAIGGHPDTAESASLAVIVAPLVRGRIPTVVEHVGTVVTPGSVIDVLVTDRGIAVNPNRPDLKEKLEKFGLHVFDIHALQKRRRSLSVFRNRFATRNESSALQCIATIRSLT